MNHEEGHRVEMSVPFLYFSLFFSLLLFYSGMIYELGLRKSKKQYLYQFHLVL